jgi:hypothetical protein
VLNHSALLDADTVDRRAHPPPAGRVCPVPAGMALGLVGPDGMNRDYFNDQVRKRLPRFQNDSGPEADTAGDTGLVIQLSG